jgi:hypothetical protein
LGFQLDLGPDFLRESLLAWERLFYALILFSVSDWETESAISSSALAKLWGTGWVSLSWPTVSGACASELALVSVQESS